MTGAAPTIPPAFEIRPPGFWRGMRHIAALELRQRLRSRTLLVLAIVWFCLIGMVTGAMWLWLSAMSGAYGQGFDSYPLFSVIVYFVLLFGTLVAPAISAGSISAERSGGTLATTQVTLIGTWSLLLGKALAAWITGFAFLVVAAPFVVISLLLSRTDPLQLLVAVLALALQIGVFTVFGVALSAMISSQVFAIVTAYLLVALLSIGTLIAFALSVGVSTRYVDISYQTFSPGYWNAVNACSADTNDEDAIAKCTEAVPVECVTEATTVPVSPTSGIWWVLTPNPYVVVADMVAPRAGSAHASDDLFSGISTLVRGMQDDRAKPQDWNDCPAPRSESSASAPSETGAPVWWIGATVQLVLAAGLLWAGHRRLRTPAAKLPRGARVA